MINSDLEPRILELAQIRGLLSTEDRTLPADESRPCGRIEALLQAGKLDEATVESLALELLQAPVFTLPTWDAEDSDTSDRPETPFTWEGYTELQPIGMGGGGLVYRAKDPQLDRWVALKFPRSDQSRRSERILREARAQAKVDHPNVVKVYEVGEQDGQPFIAMQLVMGENLWEMSRRLSVEQKVILMIQVAEGLQAAHRLGMIHLDIKPANILVEITEEGEPRPFLTDFGLVREEFEGDRPIGHGTPPYASPEQLVGDMAHVDRRSDVYSFGVTLYALLAGIPPFDTTDLAKLVKAEPIPLRVRDPRLPEDLEAITGKCMQKDPSLRYASARVVAEDLRRFLNGEPVIAQRSTLRYRAFKWFRRNRVAASLSALGALLLLAAGLWSLREARRTVIQARLALRYGQDVQAMEQRLRMAHLSRLHDRRPSVDQVRRAMERIRKEMTELGPDALAPGCYALGQGYYALDEIVEARTQLDAAWKAGFRTPECAQTRGVVLAELYQKAKSEIHTGDPAMRQKLLHQADVDFRDPALECFRVARDRSINTPYQEAMTVFQEAMSAYLMGDSVSAIAKAREAGNHAPWLYELDLFRHNLLQERAETLRAEGKVAEAKQCLEEAGQAVAHGLDIAPSNPWFWEDQGWLFLAFADEDGLPEPQKRAWVKRAQTSFETALVADPDHFEAFGGLTDIWGRMAEFATIRGEDPMPYLDRAVQCGETAIRNAPPSENSIQLFWALYWRGQAHLMQGRDVRSELDRAVEGFRRGVDRGGDWDTFKGLEISLHARGLAAYLHGEDPLPYYRDSIRWAEAASQAQQGEPWPMSEAMRRVVDLAEMELLLGKPAEQPTESLLGSLNALADRFSQEADVYFQLARGYLVSARRKELAGKDPSTDFEACLKHLQTCIRMTPWDPEMRQQLAECTLIYGHWLRRTGKPDHACLQKGLAAARASRNRLPKDDYSRALQDRLILRLAQDRVETPTARQAREDLNRVYANNPYVARWLQGIAPLP